MATKKKKPTAQAHTTQVKKTKKRAGNKDSASRALNSVVSDLRQLSPEKRKQVLRSVEAFYGGPGPTPSDEEG